MDVINSQTSLTDPLTLQSDNSEGDLSLQVNPTYTPMSEMSTREQSLKYNYALGSKSPGVEGIASHLQMGTLPDLQRVAALNEEQSLRQTRDDFLKETAIIQGGNLTPPQAYLMQTVAQMQPKVDPDTVLEKMFSDKFISHVANNDPSSTSIINRALAQDPNATHAILEGTSNYMTNRELAIKKEKELKAELEHQGWGSWLADLASEAIPLKQSLRLRLAVPGVKEASIFTGDQRIAQRHVLFALPSSDFNTQFNATVDHLKSSNLRDAYTFVKNMVDYSYGDAAGDNAQFLHEIQGAGSIVGALAPLKTLMGATVKAAGKDEVVLQEAFTQAGDLKSAGEVGAVKIAEERSAQQILQTRDPLIASENVAKQYPSLMSVKPGWDGLNPGSLSRERAMANNDILESRASQLVSGITEAPRFDRTSPEQLPVLVKAAEELMVRDFQSTNHAILDIVHRPASEFADNVGYLEMQIGTPDKLLFKTRNQADKFAQRELGLDIERYRIGDKEGLVGIEQQGNGFYISISRPINETETLARLLDIPTSAKNEETAGTGFLAMIKGTGGFLKEKVKGAIGGARTIVSDEDYSKRLMATHVPQETKRIIVEMAREIGSIRRESAGALDKVIQSDMNFVNSKLGIRGRQANSQMELDKNFKEANGRFPTEKESLAYRMYYQIMSADLLMRDLNLHRSLGREGVEMFHIFSKNEAGELSKTPYVQGSSKRDVPWEDKVEAGIVISRDGEHTFHFKSDAAKSPVKKDLDDMIAKGATVWQIANPNDRPLSSIINDGRIVNFVVTSEHGSKPLPLNLVDRKDGTHIIYPHMAMVKQPKFVVADKGQTFYIGDQTITLQESGKDAQEIAGLMDKVRIMYRDKDPNLDQFISDNFAQPKEWFDEQIKSGYISLDHPIVHTLRGQSTFDTHDFLKELYPNVRDETKSPYNLYRSVDMSFLGERDLPPFQMAKQDSMDLPRWNLTHAESIDGFQALNRAVGNAVRGMHVQDYKIYAIENWARQFGKLLQNPEQAANNPFQAFYYGVFDTKDRGALIAAESTRQRILKFLGVQSEMGKDMSYLEEKLLNTMNSSKLTKFVQSSELPFLRDPLAYFRNVLVKLKFGFNPAQYMVQAQGLSNIAAVEPRAAVPAYAAYWKQRLMGMNLNQEILDYSASKSAKWGWDPEHFKESTNLIRKFGYDIVGDEHALRSDLMDPGLFQSTLGQIADKGLFFFTEGERMVRMTGMNAAYYAWRKANPVAKLDREAEASIIRRADDLIVNMTKAGNGNLQDGTWTKTGSQFLTFNQRLFEQLWGGKLTVAEKARMFAVHSSLYGVPVAAGSWTFWPVWDDVRTQALKRGWPINDGWFKAVNDGFLSYAAEHITGQQYDIGRRYGMQGPDILRKIWHGEESPTALVTGPAGSFMNNAWNSVAYPMASAVYAGVTGGQNLLPLAKDDIIDLAREISAVNNAYNGVVAINTGKYFSRNKESLQANDVTALDGVFMALFGLTRMDITDSRLAKSYAVDRAKSKAFLSGLAETEFNRMFRALADKDLVKVQAHMERAKIFMQVFGDLDDKEFDEVYKKSLRNERNTDVESTLYKMVVEGNANFPAKLKQLIERNKKK